MTSAPPAEEREKFGLCEDCQNARQIRSDRGSVFFLCELSANDSRFAKYPRLPVLQCAGYEPKEGRRAEKNTT
jgi:hypothetical protein